MTGGGKPPVFLCNNGQMGFNHHLTAYQRKDEAELWTPLSYGDSVSPDSTIVNHG